MKATIVVTSYNYEKFVVDCVKSVEQQTYSDIEIVFVDDGSSDNTLEIVKKFNFSKLKVIEKSNGGQLSAFNAALSEITGDVVFFIDADDVYDPDYIEKVIAFYQANPDADFVYSGLCCFGDIQKSSDLKTIHSHGYTLCRTYLLRHWIGAPTSAISMRSNLLYKILPLNIEPEWRVRADDCLVWGASLVGAKKYFFGEVSVNYRVHGGNGFFGKKFNNDYLFKRELAINRMFNIIMDKNDTNITTELLIHEYRTNLTVNISELFDYIKMAFKLNISFMERFKTMFVLVKTYFKSILNVAVIKQ